MALLHSPEIYKWMFGFTVKNYSLRLDKADNNCGVVCETMQRNYLNMLKDFKQIQ